MRLYPIFFFDKKKSETKILSCLIFYMAILLLILDNAIQTLINFIYLFNDTNLTNFVPKMI
jgi:hypothetical protein